MKIELEVTEKEAAILFQILLVANENSAENDDEEEAKLFERLKLKVGSYIGRSVW